jgi:mannose-6-phosphate isomerase
MVALSDFWLLHGFLPKKELLQRLKSIPEFFELLGVFEQEGYAGLYKTVMQQPEEVTTRVLRPLMDRIYPLYKAGSLTRSAPDYWAAKAYDLASDKNHLDKGIYSIYFFNIVKAKKGEAIFQDAGIPHAYLEGMNIELMANSDNVLRGGLTSKHVDVPELLKHIKFEETFPDLIKGTLQQDGKERIFKSPAPDFELSKIVLNATQKYGSHTLSPQILMVIEGDAKLSHGSTEISLDRGSAAFIAADCDYTITSGSMVEMYKASVPLRK